MSGNIMMETRMYYCLPLDHFGERVGGGRLLGRE